MVGRGLFRKDLYYRICVAAITLPPLRERREDIPELAGYFLRALSGSKNLKADRFSPAALERLVRWDWPGNVRELRNEIQRAVIFATGSVVEAADLSIKAANDTPDKSGKATPPKLALSRDAFERMLQKHGGNLNAVARELGCARSSVYYNLRKWGLAPVRFRGI
jgi:DNA-binding NtrC family response regulator